MNPLLQPGTALPPFAEIRPEHVTPALTVLLADADAALQRASSDAVPADYLALSLALDVPVERLRRAWSAVGHLQAVADTPALRAAYAENLPRVTDFHTRLASDAGLYAKYKAIAAGPGVAALTREQRKALADTLRDFVLGGAELQGAARERFAQLQERMAELSQTFGEHVLDATDAFSLFVGEADLDGVPADLRAAARAAAAAGGHDGFKLTLQLPCYLPLMQTATHRALRERMFRAWSMRASDLGDPAFDNSAVMGELLALRAETAQLLGHGSYAQLSLVAKMAESPQQVLDFVRDLARRARPHAERERDELEVFAARELGLPDLQPWDRPFAAERLKQARFAFSSDEVRQYFTEPRVLEGLFRLVESMFGFAIRPLAASVWHDSVRCFEMTRDGVAVAAFYVDLYARAGKQGGAWMDDARQRWARPDGLGLQLPVAHLVCNFAPPVGDRPALLTHDDLITLFHEFGHGLHHMLTRVDELSLAGIAGVEWDAAELPSQFMENFCWEWDVLRRLSAHVQTGAPLPRELFDRMLAARSFQAGLQMLRHAEMGLFDMLVHADPAAAASVQAVAEAANAEISVLPAPPFIRYPHSFTHLFDGGYGAGYYGYAWAEVLSADAYGAFEEAGFDDAEVGRRYRETILETGGSRTAMENFVAFRGRGPTLDALLRHQGLA